MAYVYRHVRLDKNEVFYIGIGSDSKGKYKRAFEDSHRNPHWHNIVKHGYEVEIMLDDLTWEEACKKEVEFIKLYGRKDLNEGTLVNMTDGGEGIIGCVVTEETRKKLSKSFKGRKHSEESKIKMRGKRLKPRKKTDKVKVGHNLGKKFSEETKEKMRLKRLEYWRNKKAPSEKKEPLALLPY